MMRATKIPKRWQISWWVSIRNHTFIIPWWKSLFGNKKISCKHLIILKAPTLSVLVSFPGTFLLCAILEGWDEHFSPRQISGTTKEMTTFPFHKTNGKNAGIEALSPLPYAELLTVISGTLELAHSHPSWVLWEVPCSCWDATGVWDCLRWRDVATAEPPATKVTWHVRFRWVRILWLRMQGKCH